MFRYAAFALFLTLGLEIHLSHGVEVNVTDKDHKLCLYANLMVNFSVSYEVAGNKSETAEFELPSDVTTEGSQCGNTSSTLKLNFGEGHSWTVNFTTAGKMYLADSITFSYNLSDTRFFNLSVSNETKSVTVKADMSDVGMDTYYSCMSKEVIQDTVVNQTLWNVTIQAFIANGTKSETMTSCAADLPSTPVAPTTHTAIPTTAAPVTNMTTPVPPTPTLPTPVIGNYSISPDINTTACLMANFGLRIGFKQGEKSQEMNLDPVGATVSGSCGANTSELVLVSKTVSITFTFTNDTKKFRLHALNVSANTGSGVVFSEANSNLSLWEAAVGSSYMCNKEQSYNITKVLTIYTFDLRVQPVAVKKGVFSTAEDCQADAESFLVPIAVGVALLVLILVVLVAYFIGRKRNMARGYESF